MLEALAAGEGDPAEPAALAHPRLSATPERLGAARRGRVTAHHRLPPRPHPDQPDALGAAIGRIVEALGRAEREGRPRERIRFYARPALLIVAEIGLDTGRFPSAGHPVSRAGPCPRNDESAGKRRSERPREGAPWLKTVLVQRAWAEGEPPAGAAPPPARPPRRRRGGVRGGGLDPDRGLPHAEGRHRLPGLGPDHLDRRSREAQARRLVRRLADLGHAVELAPLGPAPA
jgi:hypothetical protein